MLLLLCPAAHLVGFMTHNGGLGKSQALKRIDSFNKVRRQPVTVMQCNHTARFVGAAVGVGDHC
jgi:hypothetical protein